MRTWGREERKGVVGVFNFGHPLVTCTRFPVVIQGVSGQAEAAVGARGALTDVLAAVVQLNTQVQTCMMKANL